MVQELGLHALTAEDLEWRFHKPSGMAEKKKEIVLFIDKNIQISAILCDSIL